jgi:hypothetical protein
LVPPRVPPQEQSAYFPCCPFRWRSRRRDLQDLTRATGSNLPPPSTSLLHESKIIDGLARLDGHQFSSVHKVLLYLAAFPGISNYSSLKKLKKN